MSIIFSADLICMGIVIDNPQVDTTGNHAQDGEMHFLKQIAYVCNNPNHNGRRRDYKI